jgi:phosphate-selective porin OprO and OprP
MNGLFKRSALMLAVAACFGTGAAMAAEVDTKGGIKVKSDDGQFVGEFCGRMHVDANLFSNDGDVDNENGTDFRRLRLEGKGTMYGVWEGKIQIDFGTGRNANSNSSVTVKDAYLAYSGFGPGKLYFGQVKTPMSLEELTSSNSITFMERAEPVSLVAPNHKRGIHYAGATGNLTYAVAAYGGENRVSTGLGANDTSAALGLGGRVTFTPIKDKTQVLHLGLSAAQESDVTGQGDVGSRYETRLADSVAILDFPANLTDGEDITRYGLEAAYVNGPFSLQAEYLKSQLDSVVGGDPEVGGYYVFASYFLTGESRPYKASAAVFDRVKPLNKSGAWEVALRYSGIEGESDNAAVTQREIKNVTAGLNYYLNPQVRFMFNLSRADIETNNGAAFEGNPTTLAMRAQFDF